MALAKETMDSDYRHLLQQSRPSSVYSYATTAVGDDTPRQSTAHLPTASASQAGASSSTANAYKGGPYKGFPSREAYLAALEAFAQERSYFKHANNLVGFYGQKTMDEYIEEGKKGQKVKYSAKGRRNTVAGLQVIDESGERGNVEGVRDDRAVVDAPRRTSLVQFGRRVLGRQSVS